MSADWVGVALQLAAEDRARAAGKPRPRPKAYVRREPGAPKPPRDPTKLSPMESWVLWFYGGEGMPIKQVAAELLIAEETAKSYLKRLREKLRAREPEVPADSRVDLFRAAMDECRHLTICQAARQELREWLDEQP